MQLLTASESSSHSYRYILAGGSSGIQGTAQTLLPVLKSMHRGTGLEAEATAQYFQTHKTANRQERQIQPVAPAVLLPLRREIKKRNLGKSLAGSTAS